MYVTYLLTYMLGISAVLSEL